jgi:signal transduction histidine kinase
MVTPGGSFCCRNTARFIENLSEAEKSRYRGVCIQNGFLSVAIVPIRYREKIIGAIHLADEMENKVSFKALEFIESVTPLIGEAVIRFDLEEEVKESEGRLRFVSSELLRIQENERKRISREIHDSLGQSLSAIKFKIESITQQMRESRYKKMAESLETVLPIIQGSIEESRRIQMDLRPSILDDLGIIATLTWFSREFQQTYSDIRIDKEIVIQENEVPDNLKTVIYRISQEALNNIAKHSEADLIHFSLKKAADRIEMTIQDNGRGFDPEETLSVEASRKGLGLTSMRERAELSGGSFTVESTVGKGTIIKAVWPT